MDLHSKFPFASKRLAVLLFVPLMAIVMACGSDESPTTVPAATTGPTGPTAALKSQVIENYARGVHHSYVVSLNSAIAMDGAIDRFIASPSAATLEAAKRAWLEARDDYGPTEAFRFYGGPIDNDDDGVEGLVNAWPLDEGYIDYVEGNPAAGIINMRDDFPVIDADLIVSLNEEGGEENVSTGWHAIEFLLWGQDLNADGPGDRPYTDYTTKSNSERRKTYLSVASDVLVSHLDGLVKDWDPNGSGNYFNEFLALDTNAALQNIITGIGELSRGELAGERMTVAYEERSQEDEHSCFSDNTHNDIIGNARGIQMVYLGNFGGVSGPGVHDLVAAADPGLAGQLEREIASSVNATTLIPAPFDKHLDEDVPNSDRGRAAVLAAIVLLEDQTDTIVSAAQSVGVTISVS